MEVLASLTPRILLYTPNLPAGMTVSTNIPFISRKCFDTLSKESLNWNRIGNAVNPALQYASYTSEWTDCSQASLPGMLWFAPSNGGDIVHKPYTKPSQILTTLQHDWKTPTTFCGETMNWGVNMNTNWVNPDGQLWSNFLTVYDSFEDRIIFVAHGKEYPSLIHEVTLDWV
ncbi:hypothetical protein DL96DRAFT_1821898 [Flagelloscypha sp. PMI_526]|nr:hypothetical protein DL96DRAFT_1821898 [Flagelloscypha sp. PMI_526]